jgi:DNA polymerase-3 subunit gamma/tau
MLNDPANAEIAVEKLSSPVTPSKGPKKFADPDLHHPLIQKILAGTSFAVQELDAASNRGIDDVRLLKERAYVPAQEGTVSVFILDEVHMLTTEAFNALLKLLEEPPAQVVFILATTDPQKIPATIVSRCVTIQFTRASDEELQASLSSILIQEKITADPDALTMLIQAADGSFRDGVKYLEHAASGKKTISVEDVNAVLNVSSQQEIQEFIDAIVAKKPEVFVAVVQRLRSVGRTVLPFHRSLVQFLADELMAAVTGKKSRYLARVSHFLLMQFNQLSMTQQELLPFLGLEVKGLEIIYRAQEKQAGSDASPPPASPVSPSQSSSTQDPQPKHAQAVEQHHELAPSEILAATSFNAGILPVDQTHAVSQGTVSQEEVASKWESILASVKQRNSSIEALLRSARLKPAASTAPNVVQIEVFYQFHREQLQTPKFKTMVEDAMIAHLGILPVIEFVLAESAKPGASLSNVSGQVQQEEQLIQLAKELLV